MVQPKKMKTNKDKDEELEEIHERHSIKIIIGRFYCQNWPGNYV